MDYKNFIKNFLRWKGSNIKQRRFIILLSFVVGILGGLAAVILKNSVHFIHVWLTERVAVDHMNILYFAFPLTGITLTVLYIRFFVKDNISHGVSRILFAISKKNGILKTHNTHSSLVASALTVGFGGSVGLEAPIVLTGAALGSRLSRLLRLNYKTTILMLGCGSAAAIAGIFNAPIAAIIFALEVLMLDLTMWSILPLMISATTGTVVSYFLMGKGVVFSFSTVDPFVLKVVPLYIALGIITGLVSVLASRGIRLIESGYSKIETPLQKIVLGGALLGLLIFLFPPLYGEGYLALKSIMTGAVQELTNGSLFFDLRDNFWWMTIFLTLVLFLKIIAMSVTTGSGGVGGVFAPSLFMGGLTGYIFSTVYNQLGFIQVSERNFTLVGMAGIMAGIMHAPLTAIFLIAEITGGYALFVPLIVTSAIAYLTTIYFEPHSIYTERLAKRGELITHHKDNAVLTLLNLNSVIEKDLKPVHPDSSLGDLVKIISKSKRNIFPVVDEDQVLYGIVLLDNVREIIFNPEMYDSTKVSDLMISPPALIDINIAMTEVMKKFEESDAWNLPVVNDGKYVGFVSKAKIFNQYRKLLVQFSDE